MKDIKQMAVEAFGPISDSDVQCDACKWSMSELARFAALVAEDCAKAVEEALTKGRSPMGRLAAEAIRARWGVKEG